MQISLQTTTRNFTTVHQKQLLKNATIIILKYQHATEIGKHIWQSKNNNFNYSIKWSIASKVYGHADSLLETSNLCLFQINSDQN